MTIASVRNEAILRLEDQAIRQPLEVRASLQRLLVDLQNLDPQEAKSFQEDPRIQRLFAHLALP